VKRLLTLDSHRAIQSEHIPKQRHRVTNWAAYDIALRQRGSLTVWFTEAAIAAWKAEPRATRGGQPRYSALAITTALTRRAVFGLALRQTEGLIASLVRLLGLDLAAPDHSTMSRRGETLQVPRPRPGSEPVHLLVDSTGLKLCGPGEWLVEKHATRTRRSWRKLHIGVDTDTGQIIATELTSKDVDDGSQVGPLLEQVAGPVRRLPAMERTIGTMSTVRSASVIRMQRSLCRPVRARCQPRRQRPRRRSATGTCS
jgi:Transposase DDE domain